MWMRDGVKLTPTGKGQPTKGRSVFTLRKDGADVENRVLICHRENPTTEKQQSRERK